MIGFLFTVVSVFFLLRIHRVGWQRCYSLGRPLSVGMLAVVEKVVVVVEMSWLEVAWLQCGWLAFWRRWLWLLK